MKTRKNMLRSSVAMLLVSVLALTTATYAWFTNGHGGKVDEITLTAATANGIELSADAITWGGTIAYSDLTSVSTNQMLQNATMEPLSSAGTVSTGTDKGQLRLYTGTISEEGKLTTSLVSNFTDAKCVKFDFYVRNSGTTDATLYLDLNDKKSSVSEKVSEGSPTTGVDKAVRVAFIDQGGTQDKGISITGVSATDAESAKSLKSGTTSTVWEPNPGESKAYVVKSEIATNNAIAVADGIVSVDENSAYKDSFTQLSTVTNANGKYVKIAEIGSKRISKVTVYIWLEGQDADCTNNATGGKFNVNLVFSNQGSTSTAGNQ